MRTVASPIRGGSAPIDECSLDSVEPSSLAASYSAVRR